MEFKAEIKKTFTGPDKLRAVCSVVLDDCFLVKNVRVVERAKRGCLCPCPAVGMSRASGWSIASP